MAIEERGGGDQPEELEHVVQWVETQRRQLSGTALDGANYPEVFPETLSEHPRQCHGEVKAHFETGGDEAPLRMLALGAVGTGSHGSCMSSPGPWVVL